MRVNTSPTKHLCCMCMCLWGCVCDLPDVFECVTVFVPRCTSVRGRVSLHGYCSLEQVCMSTILVRACEGASQHVCASACSELSAPAGCAIPIYPSAKEAGGKSAGHCCRRFRIRGTRLPVRRPLRGGDEGGRLPRHSVWGGVGIVWGRRECWKKGRAERLWNL